MNSLSKMVVVTVIMVVSLFTGFIPSHAADPVSKKPIVTGTVIKDNEITKFVKDFPRAYKKGDVDEYMSFYTAGVLENGSNPFDKIKADYLYTIAQNIITVYEIEISDIKNLGDSVTLDAVYNKTFTDKTNGDAFITSGNVRIRLVKEADVLKVAAIDYDKYIKNDYTIGAEDVLEVSVWKSPDLSTTIMVRPDGMISLPLIGDIMASSRTAKELKEEIEQKLSEYKQNPIVSIIVKEANSQAIFVTGEVARPGKYPLRSDTTIIQAITLAGGFTQWADKDKILVIRKSPMNPEGNRFTVRYSDILSGKNMKANILLKPGDTVIVP